MDGAKTHGFPLQNHTNSQLKKIDMFAAEILVTKTLNT